MEMNDYYKRKTEADYVEEQIRSRRGCRLLFFIMLALLAIAVILSVWL
jgi:predicted nucleic acid-binding Zn ribbon protein